VARPFACLRPESRRSRADAVQQQHSADGRGRDDDPPADPDARDLTGLHAANVKRYRQIRELDQDDVATAMQDLGHAWRQVTVSEVERLKRNVTVPEMVALVMVLGASIEQLLDPRGPGSKKGPDLALSDRTMRVTGDEDDGTLLTAMGPIPQSHRRTIPARYVSGLVCSHKYWFEVIWSVDSRELKGTDVVEGRPGLTDVGPDGPEPSS